MGVGGGEQQHHRRPRPDAHDVGPLGPDVVEHGPHVVHPVLEIGEPAGGHGVGQAGAALVERDDLAERAHPFERVGVRRPLPAGVEVAEPVGHEHERRPVARELVGDVDLARAGVTGGRRAHRRSSFQVARALIGADAARTTVASDHEGGRPTMPHKALVLTTAVNDVTREPRVHERGADRRARTGDDIDGSRRRARAHRPRGASRPPPRRATSWARRSCSPSSPRTEGAAQEGNSGVQAVLAPRGGTRAGHRQRQGQRRGEQAGLRVARSSSRRRCHDRRLRPREPGGGGDLGTAAGRARAGRRRDAVAAGLRRAGARRVRGDVGRVPRLADRRARRDGGPDRPGRPRLGRRARAAGGGGPPGPDPVVVQRHRRRRRPRVRVARHGPGLADAR